MAESQQKIDWDEVRRAALDCLTATWDLVRWSERSQEDDYDVAGAALHLAVIDTARATFRRAMEVLQPGFERATDDSNRYSPVFDALALAIAHRSERPDFRYGPVCCATAHEAAFELLRSSILWCENGLNSELDEEGIPDQYVAGIDDLHKHSPDQLRDTLVRLERRESLQLRLRVSEVRQIRAWISHEWAAVSGIAPKPATGGDGPKLRVKVHPETHVVEIDGTPYPLSGHKESKERLVAFIQALIDAKGAPVSATDHGIRTRDIERQHDKIRSLIGDDAKAGSGHRIPLEKLLA